MRSRHTLILTLITLMTLAVFLTPIPAAAQSGGVPIDALTITIWPEFDQPSALVFYTGTLVDPPALPSEPTEITFPLPPEAAINAVAYVHSSGQLANASFSVERSTVTMLSPNGTFHIEFYDPTIQINGSQREYTFVWQSPNPVNDLIWEAQQPAGAESMTVSPGEATLGRDTVDLNSYTVDAGPVEAGQAASLTLRYDKPSAALSIDVLQGDSQPAADRPPQGADVPLWAVIVVVVVMMGLAGTAGYFFSRYRTVAADLEEIEEEPERPTAPAASPAGPVEPAAKTAAPVIEANPEMLAADAGLTDREIEVLELLAQGKMNKEIGRALDISPRTVSRHRENMMRKLEVHSRTDLVKFAIRIGLIDLHDEQ